MPRSCAILRYSISASSLVMPWWSAYQILMRSSHISGVIWYWLQGGGGGGGSYMINTIGQVVLCWSHTIRRTTTTTPPPPLTWWHAGAVVPPWRVLRSGRCQDRSHQTWPARRRRRGGRTFLAGSRCPCWGWIVSPVGELEVLCYYGWFDMWKREKEREKKVIQYLLLFQLSRPILKSPPLTPCHTPAGRRGVGSPPAPAPHSHLQGKTWPETQTALVTALGCPGPEPTPGRN